MKLKKLSAGDLSMEIALYTATRDIYSIFTAYNNIYKFHRTTILSSNIKLQN